MTTEAECAACGVSVRYAPEAGKEWYVLRVTYGRMKAARRLLDTQRIAYYTPMHRRIKMVRGRREKVTEPLLPYLLFAYAGRAEMDELVKRHAANNCLTYYYNHFATDASGKNPPLTIGYYRMAHFISVTSADNEYVRLVSPQNCRYRDGDMVRVTGGDFRGVEGRVARVAGQQRVIVELEGLCLVATAYIPTAFIEKK